MKFDWIPQLFMDLLGRVLPGALIIVVSVAVVAEPQRIANGILSGDMAPAAASFVVWGMLAYFIGFALGQLWNMTFGLFLRSQIGRIQHECKAGRLAEHNRLMGILGGGSIEFRVDQLPPIYVMHDHLRLSLPAQASRLLKLRSECRLCHVVILGFGALCALNTWYLWQETTASRLTVEGFLLVSILSCWSRQLRLEHYFTNGTCIAWLALASSTGALPSVVEPEAAFQERTTPANQQR